MNCDTCGHFKTPVLTVPGVTRIAMFMELLAFKPFSGVNRLNWIFRETFLTTSVAILLGTFSKRRRESAQLFTLKKFQSEVTGFQTERFQSIPLTACALRLTKNSHSRSKKHLIVFS